MSSQRDRYDTTANIQDIYNVGIKHRLLLCSTLADVKMLSDEGVNNYVTILLKHRALVPGIAFPPFLLP